MTLVTMRRLAPFALLAPLACGNGDVTYASADASDLDVFQPRGAGERCDDGGHCRAGLACTDGTCKPAHTIEEGGRCAISAECKEGLFCDASRKCARSGNRTAGQTCGSEADCASGLRCNPIGLAAECQPEGTKDVGASCALGSECFGGLICMAKTCSPFPESRGGAPPVAVSTWKGVDCAPESGAVAADFRVPRAPGDQDFFRLPFPNDVRRKNGKLDLAGFPSPGADVLGYDLVDRYRQYLEATSDGFSVYPTITMRFSAPIDYATLEIAGALRMVDLGTGADVGFTFSATTTRTQYVCENALTARMPPGAPLESGHTYAFFVTNVAKATGGAAIGVPADLKSLLAASDPGAPLSDAWNVYAPLRAWAASTGFDFGTLVNATVFTVARSRDAAQQIGDAVAAAPFPTPTSWIRCGSAPSSCPLATGERACGPADPAFDELHAIVKLPVWQKGKAPYATPADGGDVDGTAQGTEDVCMSLTVPKAPMPAGGWPVVIYSPEIGGSFRSSLADGLAARLASADTKIAVLTIDPPLHGTRGGGAAAKQASIAYPTQNPGAMRGRALQGEADVLALVRVAAFLHLTDVTSPTGTALDLAPSPILVGVGEGATATALAAPRIAIGGVVLAGVPASFADAVVGKRAIADFVDIAPVVLGETSLTPSHPAVALLANALDAADPLDHAGSLVLRPITSAKPTFVVYGQGDTFTPGPMQRAFATAAGLGIASPPPTVSSPDEIGSPVLPVPAGGNVAGTTAIVRQYAPQGFDGHLVFVRDPDATRDVDHFVADLFLGKIPMVGR